MQAISVKQILDVAKGRFVCGRHDQEIREFSLDSRTIRRGDMFIAIKGERFDGHQFLREVTEKGALGIIVAEGYALPERLPQIVIRVKDTVDALGDIAGIYRRQFQGPVISVTGTVGKTGAKEFIAGVLSQRFRVHKTQGTLNNHIGVPVTLMALGSHFDVSVIELGMNRLGEIRRLASITQPDVGIITNVGPAHLEYLGSVESIVTAKAELLEVLGRDKLVILNGDNSYYSELRKNVRSRLITVGKGPKSDFQAVDLVMDKGNGRANFKIIAKPFNGILEVSLPVIGMHNIYPALIATAVGYGLGLKPDEIISGLMKISLPHMRMELREIAGIRIIDDCYNANPVSMAGALDTLAGLNTVGRKIFVCGDMLELGKDAARLHQELGRKVIECGVDRLVTIGKFSRYVSKVAIENGIGPEDIRDCETNTEAVEVLAHWLEPGDIVLVKGSRANRMEGIIKGIEEYYNVLEQLMV